MTEKGQQIKEAIEAGRVDAFMGYERVRSEVKYGENSRIDLLLESDAKPSCFVEIKNVTLLTAPGTAAFPDSVSKRAAKHMVELAQMKKAGHRAVVLFLVSRTDAKHMRPADEIDPKYGEALRAAVASGVEALAYQLDFDAQSVSLGSPLPIVL